MLQTNRCRLMTMTPSSQDPIPWGTRGFCRPDPSGRPHASPSLGGEMVFGPDPQG